MPISGVLDDLSWDFEEAIMTAKDGDRELEDARRVDVLGCMSGGWMYVCKMDVDVDVGGCM